MHALCSRSPGLYEFTSHIEEEMNTWSPAQPSDSRRTVRLAEHGTAGDKHIGPGLYRQASRMFIDSAIHLDFNIHQTQAVQQIPQFLYLRQHGRDELLTPKTRIDRHQQYIIQIGQHMLNSLDRRGGIQDDSALHSLFFDQMKRSMQVDAGFGVNGDQVRAGSRKRLYIPLRLFDHQMDVKRKTGMGPDGFHNQGPIVMLGTKCPSMTSTWIQSAPASSASLISSPSLEKIRRKYRWCDSEHD